MKTLFSIAAAMLLFATGFASATEFNLGVSAAFGHMSADAASRGHMTLPSAAVGRVSASTGTTSFAGLGAAAGHTYNYSEQRTGGLLNSSLSQTHTNTRSAETFVSAGSQTTQTASGDGLHSGRGSMKSGGDSNVHAFGAAFTGFAGF